LVTPAGLGRSVLVTIFNTSLDQLSFNLLKPGFSNHLLLDQRFHQLIFILGISSLIGEQMILLASAF